MCRTQIEKTNTEGEQMVKTYAMPVNAQRGQCPVNCFLLVRLKNNWFDRVIDWWEYFLMYAYKNFKIDNHSVLKKKQTTNE